MAALLRLALAMVNKNPQQALNLLQDALDILKSNPTLLVDLVNHFQPKE